MADPEEYLAFEHRSQWRRWLEKNHALRTEAWLVLFKKKFQDEGLGLDEAVEEALCFGWIDGKARRLEEKRFALRFSPRQANGVWSMSNIRRVEKLIADGQMMEAGHQKIAEAKDNGQWAAAIRREQVDIIPDDLKNALQKRDRALAAYEALPDSRKKQYLYWLQSAKQEETRRRRVEKIVEETVKG